MSGRKKIENSSDFVRTSSKHGKTSALMRGRKEKQGELNELLDEANEGSLEECGGGEQRDEIASA